MTAGAVHLRDGRAAALFTPSRVATVATALTARDMAAGETIVTLDTSTERASLGWAFDACSDAAISSFFRRERLCGAAVVLGVRSATSSVVARAFTWGAQFGLVKRERSLADVAGGTGATSDHTARA